MHKIEKLYNKRKSPTEIGRLICRNKNVILKEIRRYGKMNQPSSSAIRAGQKKHVMKSISVHDFKKIEPFLKYFKNK